MNPGVHQDEKYCCRKLNNSRQILSPLVHLCTHNSMLESFKEKDRGVSLSLP